MIVQLKDGDVMDFTKQSASPEQRPYTKAEAAPELTATPIEESEFDLSFETAPAKKPIAEHVTTHVFASGLQHEPLELPKGMAFDWNVLKLDTARQQVAARIDFLEEFGGYVTDEQAGYLKALKWVQEKLK